MRHIAPGQLREMPVHARALPIRAGTRGSPLALVQTRAFLDTLAAACPALSRERDLREDVINTTGDAVQDRPLADIGGKGLFAKEIHEALLRGDIDLAVHSLKDLDTELPAGVALACMLPREDPRDCLILGPDCGETVAGDPLSGLCEGAVVGTSSVRRQAQLLHLRPDLRIVTFRGNVQTRLRKLSQGDCHASLLALAGLRRLGMQDAASVVIDPHVMLPACGQGIVAVTCRSADRELLGLLDAMSDPAAKAAAIAERAMLDVLDGSCRTPIGAYASLLPGGEPRLRLSGLVAHPDGGFLVRREAEGHPIDAARIGRELGMELRALCPADLLREFVGVTGRPVPAMA